MKKNRNWWIFPLALNVAFSLPFTFPKWLVAHDTVHAIAFYGSAATVVIDIVLIIWWFTKLVPIETGMRLVVTRLGGIFSHSVISPDEGFYNTEGTVNYDSRYPDGYYIPFTKENGKVLWGPPGYLDDLPADPDRKWKNSLSYFERVFGYHFPGFFTKVEPQLIHTHILKARPTVSEAEVKKAKFADKNWAVFEEFKEYANSVPIYDEDVIVVSAKTGADGAVNDDKLRNEFLDINIPIGIQTLATNPKQMMIKTTDMHPVLVDRIDAVVRDMVAGESIKKLQSGNHSSYTSEFVTKLLEMNGKWQKDAATGRYYLTDGLDLGYGFRITKQCALKEWSPATEMAEKMLNSTREITISANEIDQKRNKGMAAAAETEEAARGEAKRIELISTAQANGDKLKRQAAIDGGVNPEIAKIWDNIGNLKGNVYFGDGVKPVTNVDSQTGIAEAPPKPAKKEKPEPPKKDEDKEKGGGHA